MELESDCMRSISSGRVDLILLQKYKLETIKSENTTENTDKILSYFLLYLLSTGEKRRFSLNLAEITKLQEKQELKLVSKVDLLWKSSLLGDIPQIKQSLTDLPEIFERIKESAFNSLQNKEETGEIEEKKESKIQKIIRESNMFFRV